LIRLSQFRTGGLVRWLGGGDEHHCVKTAIFGCRFGASQVPEVDRIEAPAKAKPPGASRSQTAFGLHACWIEWWKHGSLKRFGVIGVYKSVERSLANLACQHGRSGIFTPPDRTNLFRAPADANEACRILLHDWQRRQDIAWATITRRDRCPAGGCRGLFNRETVL